jgi:hypothetical protein
MLGFRSGFSCALPMLAAVMLFAGSAMAVEPAGSGGSGEAQKVVQQMMIQYVSITGAHYIEKRCNHMPDVEEKQFEADRANCTEKFRNVLKMPESMLQQIDQKAKEKADNTKQFPCGDKTREFVNHSITMASNLSKGMNLMADAVKNSTKASK